jgi:hypothetical protein
LAAVINKVELAAAHEGVAELIVGLLFDNGGTSRVSLDAHTSRLLMDACAASGPEDLIGQNWEKVRDALSQSYNRHT